MFQNKVNVDWEVDFMPPSCAFPDGAKYVRIDDVSERIPAKGEQRRIGIPAESMDPEATFDLLYESLIASLDEGKVPRELWPKKDAFELRWKPGSDRLASWIDAILVEREQ